MLTIKTDGTIYSLGIKWTGNSIFELMPPTRDITESTYADGVIDFGTELETGEIELQCVSNDGLTKAEIATLKATLTGELNSLRSYDMLTFESDPEKALYVRLARRPEITEHPGWFEITITLKYKPIWVSVDEQELVGSGTIENEGTFDAPLVIEIEGPVIDPAVTVGEETLSYDGTLEVSDILIIDTGTKTAKLNSDNALGDLTGDIDIQLPIGETEVTAATGGTTTFKWRHCWI